ncbi:MAG: ABC transporter permease, partial [Bacteroidetes bacterium]|nr:ABC transporter permease [Bacteroidota bacterium]
GSDFYQDSHADSSQVIITASLAGLMGKGSAIGRILRNGNKQYTVKGVIKDYVYGDMNSVNSDPVIFFGSRSQGRYLYVRGRPQAATADVLAALETVLHKNNPGYPFEYSFVDDQYASVFSTETLTGRLSRIFAALAILISCLGLFGLAAYTAERRTKEIGVRKVLGAGSGRIAIMLSRDFLQLVLIAALIAFPIAAWYMQRWLQEYTYRVSLQAWVFAAAGGAALLIALATIGLRAVKAGIMSPVKSLRSE